MLKVLKVGEDAAIVVVLGTMHAHATKIKLNICPYLCSFFRAYCKRSGGAGYVRVETKSSRS